MDSYVIARRASARRSNLFSHDTLSIMWQRDCHALAGLAMTNIATVAMTNADTVRDTYRSVIARRAPAARRSNLFSCGTLYIMGLGDCHVLSGLAMTEFSLLCGLVWQFVNVRRIAEFLTF